MNNHRDQTLKQRRQPPEGQFAKSGTTIPALSPRVGRLASNRCRIGRQAYGNGYGLKSNQLLLPLWDDGAWRNVSVFFTRRQNWLVGRKDDFNSDSANHVAKGNHAVRVDRLRIRTL